MMKLTHVGIGRVAERQRETKEKLKNDERNCGGF
jgi:hypothetical protein